MFFRNFPHDFVDGVFPGTLAHICGEMGIERLVHISHLAASLDAPGIMVKRGSDQLRAKVRSSLQLKCALDRRSS